MANPELGPIENAFKPLVETIIPPEESDVYVQQMTKVLHKRVALRLLEDMPEDQRREVALLLQQDQVDAVLEKLSAGLSPERLHDIFGEEAERLTSRWVKQIVPHLSESQAFKLRHALTQME